MPDNETPASTSTTYNITFGTASYKNAVTNLIITSIKKSETAQAAEAMDEDGTIVNHWPWSFSGWAEDADGNYGPWHYELFIPVPVPKGSETGKYEVGYTEAYDFWSNPAGAPMQVFRVSDGKQLLTPLK